MTTNRNDPFWIDLGFLPVQVAYASSQKAWNKIFRSLGQPTEPIPKADGHCTFFERRGKVDRATVIITMGKACRNYSVSQVAGLVAHECLHALHYIKTAIGETEHTQEFETYLLQAMVQGILYAHQQRRKKPWKPHQ